MSQNTGDNNPPNTVPNLQLQAIMGEMRRLLREEFEQIHERLDRVEEGAPRKTRRNRAHQREDENEGNVERVVSDEDQGRRKKEDQPTSSATPKPATIATPPQVKTIPTESHSSEIRCFKCQGLGHIANQCPNQRLMMIQESGEIDSEDEDDLADMPPLEDASDNEYGPESGEMLALVTRRVLNSQAKEEEEEVQREKIFHTRCHVRDKVLVSFRIGKYEDEVLCDVVPMQAGRLLLGRPWHFEQKVQHDGFTNKYSFTFRQRTITLTPLTPKQVYEDQMRLQNLSGFAPGASMTIPFDPGGDLRTNPSKERGNDENTKTQVSSQVD